MGNFKVISVPQSMFDDGLQLPHQAGEGQKQQKILVSTTQMFIFKGKMRNGKMELSVLGWG